MNALAKPLRRTVVRSTTFIGICLLTSAVSAQETGSQIGDRTKFQDWTVRCIQRDNALPCDLIHQIIQVQTKERVLSISIAYSPQENKDAIQITLPLGIWLEHGVELHIDDFKVPDIRVRRCDLNGCYVEASLEDELRVRLQSGADARMIVYDPQKNPIPLPFSLKGFAEGYQYLVQQSSYRLSR